MLNPFTVLVHSGFYQLFFAIIPKKWYNKKQENLGTKFSDYVFDCFDEIKVRPLIYPNKHRYTREMYIKKYPYLIIYSIEEKYIFILRVFPCKNNPKKKYK